jgi:hypothetical protein
MPTLKPFNWLSPSVEEASEYSFSPNEHIIAASEIPRFDENFRITHARPLTESCYYNDVQNCEPTAFKDAYLTSLMPLPALIILAGLVSLLIFFVFWVFSTCAGITCCFARRPLNAETAEFSPVPPSPTAFPPESNPLRSNDIAFDNIRTQEWAVQFVKRRRVVLIVLIVFMVSRKQAF